ncbi:hypothetical protein C8R47DRAFT_1286581 [Mycena vitilis]|nr:hypothetical protein C8R47DRAFT_1286581 [Mycena vitilis]
MPEIPQKLVDAILEKVPILSLGACAMTATAFVATSQRRMFRWMRLGLSSSQVHPGEVIEHRDLSIVGAAAGPFESNQIAQNPCLIEFLSLPSLRCFALQNLKDVPASLVARALAAFEQVLLFRISILEDEAAGENTSLGDLWYLGVIDGGYDTILPFLLQPTYGIHARLGEARRYNPAYPRGPPTQIQGAPGVLREHAGESNTGISCVLPFVLKCLSDTLPEQPPTYLPALTEMIFLELWIDVELTKTADVFHSIISATLASTPHLELLTLAILDRPANFHRRHRQQWTARAPAEWANLDAMLMDREDLCEVEFSLRHFPNEPERYAAFVPFIHAHLPRLFEAELLTFNCRDLKRHPMDEFAVDW